jgi:phage terminase large subunit-like protein
VLNQEPEPLPCHNRYCRLQPTKTQELFYELEDREVFFGGAAGGGKSIALLMGALRFIDVPGYAALIIRKDFSRLELAGGLIPRSHEWFKDSTARWIASRRQWIFPIKDQPGAVPATIMFGYLNRPLDKFRYASSEFQYIAFDELTDFAEEDYLFLFSRLRRNTSVQVPLRMRSASNPGGVGHAWVKERFIGQGSGMRNQESGVAGTAAEQWSQESNGAQGNWEFMELVVGGAHRKKIHGTSPTKAAIARETATAPRMAEGYVFRRQGRLYVPSRIADNPHLDGEEYRQSLLHLPPVERERLMNGDWNVQRQAQFKADSLRYYVEDRGQVELLEPSGRILVALPPGTCYRFVTIDPAGTSQEKAQEAGGYTPSWSVIQVWERPPREWSKFLILRHQVRERVAFDELCKRIESVHAEWQPQQIWIEGEKLGVAIESHFRQQLPIQTVPTGNREKVARAGPLIIKFAKGEIFIPQDNTTWRPALEAEFLAWTGDKREPADQIDAAAYAVIVAGQSPPPPICVRLGVLRS